MFVTELDASTTLLGILEAPAEAEASEEAPADGDGEEIGQQRQRIRRRPHRVWLI
jgi:hypothetical protein